MLCIAQTSTERSEVGANTPLLRSRRQTPLWCLSACTGEVYWGFEGAVHGFAANEELLKHYIDVFHAEYLGMLHQYQFFIDEEQAKELLEVYHYEWNET